MRIIGAYFMLRSHEWQRVVCRASMRIKRGVRISTGQIIRAILYNRGWVAAALIFRTGASSVFCTVSPV